jgi:hypothetical protein
MYYLPRLQRNHLRARHHSLTISLCIHRPVHCTKFSRSVTFHFSQDISFSRNNLSPKQQKMDARPPSYDWSKANSVHNADWTPAYVILALIPVVFISTAVYSVLSSRGAADAARRPSDIEMSTVQNETYERMWFPWRDAIRATESPFEDDSANCSSSSNTHGGSSSRSHEAMLSRFYVPTTSRDMARRNSDFGGLGGSAISTRVSYATSVHNLAVYIEDANPFRDGTNDGNDVFAVGKESKHEGDDEGGGGRRSSVGSDAAIVGAR